MGNGPRNTCHRAKAEDRKDPGAVIKPTKQDNRRHDRAWAEERIEGRIPLAEPQADWVAEHHAEQANKDEIKR